MVGNNVGVYIDDVKLLKAQRGGGMQGAGENNLLLSDGGTLPQNQIVSRTHTTQLNCIYTGKAIENEFLKIAEGCAQDVNKIYTYRIEYPAFTISVPVKIQAVSVTDGAGVFLQYTLTLQTAGRRQAVSNIPTQGTMNIVIQMPGETGGSNTAGGNSPNPADPQQEGGLSANPVQAEDKNKQTKLATAIQAAKTIGTQALNAAVSNIGLATGNMYAQQRAEAALSAVSTVTGLAVAAVNPVTFGVAVAGMAISAGSQIYKEYKQREYDNYVAAQNARRAGFTENRR